MALPLLDIIARRQAGACLYGLAPPKRATPADQLEQIATQQRARLDALDVDGVVVYDLQDEAERTSAPRPFPFLPTVPADVYAHTHLGAFSRPKVVYRSVANDTRDSFIAWLLAKRPAADICVLVGAPSKNATGGLSLREAYRLVEQHAPAITLGGVAIAERHESRLDEHERLLSKTDSGCRFFVTQAVYDVTSTLSLLSDYSLALNARGAQPCPIFLTFSPCGSVKTLDFMKWLGIRFPRWLENELRFAPDPLKTSLKLCERIFNEAWAYARDKRVPLGVNVESVSIRKAEIDASVELVEVFRAHMRQNPY